jgi:hypothetical protein
VERLASLIGASQPTGLDQRSGVGESTTTVTETSRRWRSGCARNFRPGELRSNVGSTNIDKEQNDEPIAPAIYTRAAGPNQCW